MIARPWPLLAFLTVGLAGPSLAQAQSRADRVVQSFMQKGQVPGLAYVILRDGVVVSQGAFGVVDQKTKEPVNAGSVFPIASLSKPFVALGILSLAEANQLNLTDTVGKYLPDLPVDWKPIPLIRLLDHTSGVPDHYNAGKWNVTDLTPISSDDLIKKLTTLPLRFKYGEKFEYSNGNYALLAKVIEKVTGKPYEQYLADKIFTPLFMTNTKVLHLEDLPNIVSGYIGGPNGGVKARWNPDWCYGNGQIGATIAT